MKQDVLDVLMYLFENYLGDETVSSQDQDVLKVELIEAGFPASEIKQAFVWLEGLAALQDHPQQQALLGSQSMRIYASHEATKLSMETRGFILFLEQVGVLDQAHRELVIDRLMALELEEIDLEQVKWVVLMVLFNQPGQETAFAWVEDWVFEEVPARLH